MSSFEAEDISDDDFYDLSQSSHLSQFSFSQDAADDPNFENDSEYLPESEDESSQEFSQVLYIGLNFSLEVVLHLRSHITIMEKTFMECLCICVNIHAQGKAMPKAYMHALGMNVYENTWTFHESFLHL